MNYYQTKNRVKAHETNLKIEAFDFAGLEDFDPRSSRKIVSEEWRFGGGCIPRSAERATLVRRVVDKNYDGMLPTSRYGALLD